MSVQIVRERISLPDDSAVLGDQRRGSSSLAPCCALRPESVRVWSCDGSAHDVRSGFSMLRAQLPCGDRSDAQRASTGQSLQKRLRRAAPMTSEARRLLPSRRTRRNLFGRDAGGRR